MTHDSIPPSSPETQPGVPARPAPQPDLADLVRSTLADVLSRKIEVGEDGGPLAARSRAANAGAGTEVDSQGRVLNEEGLPFQDVVERLDETTWRGAPAAPSPPTPLGRGDLGDDEARRAWTASLLDALELEEAEAGRCGEGPGEVGVAPGGQGPHIYAPAAHHLRNGQAPEAPPIQSPGNVATSSSASTARSRPVRSALKSTPPTTPAPRFGSSAISRGFLNLNPSSPAAERSADPIDAPVATSGHGERMGRSVEVPRAASAKPNAPRKTVRIQSPPGEDRSSEAGGRDEEEDTRDEAQRLVELLGPRIIKGHPAADRILAELDGVPDSSTSQVQEVSRITGEKPKPEARKAPVGEQVVERGVARPDATRSSARTPPDRSGLQFRPGFLRGARRRGDSGALSTPARSIQSEPLLPHARPSQAFAEKLRQRAALRDAAEDDGAHSLASRREVQLDQEDGQDHQVDLTAGSDEARSASLVDSDDGSEEAATDAEDTEDELALASEVSDWSEDDSDASIESPSLNGLADDFDNVELAREYARIKAGLRHTMENGARELLTSSNASGPHSMGWSDGGRDAVAFGPSDDEGEGTDIVAPVSPAPAGSRFRRTRIARAAGFGPTSRSSELSVGLRGPTTDDERAAEEAGHELLHLLEGARNVGPVDPSRDSAMQATSAKPRPVMVVPQLAPVHYPVQGTLTPHESGTVSGPVELQGSEEAELDEVALMDVMRHRLDRRDQGERQSTSASDASSAAKGPSQETRAGDAEAPPRVERARNKDRVPSEAGGSGIAKAEGSGSAKGLSDGRPPSLHDDVPRKAVSRFKAARMGNISS